MPSPSRTHIRITRSDGREFISGNAAARELLGTPTEISFRDVYRMRPILRAGGSFTDRHGFTWSSIGGTVSESAIAWSDFTFGVELEVLAPFSIWEMQSLLRDFAGWKVVGDGSLTSEPGFEAMEVVSPILQGQAGTDTLRAVMDLMKSKRCRVNNSCGMHVHIGVRGMKPARLRKIAIAFLNNEANFDSLVPPSRNNNRFCQSNVALFRSRRDTTLAAATTIAAMGQALNGGNSSQHYNQYRYYKLNFQSFVRHGTIEFRQHSGTVESEKAIAWVRLIAGFCASAASAAQEQLSAPVAFDTFLSAAVADESVKTYLVARRAKFSPEN
jgi:hypothetical protein